MPDTITAAEAWLATADPDPVHATRWLQSAKIVLLPLGRVWAAVKTSEHEGLAAAAVVPGPIIHDPVGRAVYFLIPPDAGWGHPDSVRLGDTCWLSTPVPSVTEPPGSYWISPPDGSGLLVDVVRLQAALVGRAEAGQ
ncbi:hypothetical protein ACIPJG_33880 [Streptomyces halstedii]|uniref:hypothetical protein n=1 Tax=Streptomyces halstedii TaxID=1944 RepID=UPI00381AA85A